MTLPAHTLKSGAAYLPRYLFLTFFMLVCFALSQKAQAQATATVADAMATEGTDLSFSITLDTAVAQQVTVDIAYSIEATDTAALTDIDVAAAQQSLLFILGRTSYSFRVPTINDTMIEEDETFTVTFTPRSIGEGVVQPLTFTSFTATGTIVNDDTDNRLSISPTSPSVTEGGTFTFTVALNEAHDASLSIVWEVESSGTNAATIAAPSDMNPASDLTASQPIRGDFNFSIGDTSAQFTIATNNDTEMEEDETFTVSIRFNDNTSTPVGVTLGTSEATATITDNDDATVSLSPLTPSVTEGGTFTFTVTASEAAPSAFSVNVDLTATGMNAATLPNVSTPAVNPDVTGSTQFLLDFAIGDTTKTFTIPATDDTIDEENETFTATLTVAPSSSLPSGWNINGTAAVATATIIDNDGDEGVSPPPPDGVSTLIEPRLEMASAALRRHAARFGNLTSTVVHNRLNGHASGLTLEDGAMAVGGEAGEKGAWLNASYAKFNGDATGRQADIYGGVDFLDDHNNWLVGALIGYEPVDLDFNDVSYEANYTHFGLYGGARVSETLMLDGAISYGTASPDISSETASASYDADRFTVRAGLTGDLGIKYALINGSMAIAPELRILYTRESLDGFTDSDGGVAPSKDIELGRLSLGPRLTWSFVNGSQVVGSIRAQWDFSDLDDGVDEEVSGAADVGVRVTLAPNVDLGLYGDIDGIGITNHYITYGGRVELNARF